MYGEKFQIRMVFQTETTDPTSKRRYVVSRLYVNSLHRKATLRKDLEVWRSRRFSETEAQNIDLESYIGSNALLNVVHHVADDGRVFANITSILPLPTGTPKLTALDYTRRQNRENKTTTWPTKPVPRPAPPSVDTPMPEADETAAPPDDAFAVEDVDATDDDAIGF
jgi:hypothetical protein